MAKWLDRFRPVACRVASVATEVLDWIYPGHCDSCGKATASGEAMCSPCRGAIPGLREPYCETCGDHFDGAIEGGFACANCRGQTFSFEFARPGVPRSDQAMELVRSLKYGRKLYVAGELARFAERAFHDPRLQHMRLEGWPLVPVPLHWRRQRWRQFNQAMEMARPLGSLVGLPVVDLLKRVRPTVTQTRLTRSQRQKNLRGAFEVKGPVPQVPGVILVDDVFTTGSTVNECSRILRRAGVQKVVVVTAMRG
ncbi:MAG: ComF family protein [Verrucomicrobiales bacterium]